MLVLENVHRVTAMNARSPGSLVLSMSILLLVFLLEFEMVIGPGGRGGTGGKSNKVTTPTCTTTLIDNICYWTEDIPKRGEVNCTDGEWGYVPNNETWSKLLQELGTEFSKYKGVYFGIYNKPTPTTQTTSTDQQWYDINGELINWLDPNVVRVFSDKNHCIFIDKEKLVNRRCDNSELVLCERSIQDGCPGKVINSRCFWLDLKVRGLFHAHMVCAQKGGQAAIPKNAEESLELGAYAGERVFIGITSLLFYTYTGQVIQWHNWAEREPNERALKGAKISPFCALLNRGTMKWSTIECNSWSALYGLCAKNIVHGNNCTGLNYSDEKCFWLAPAKSASSAHALCVTAGGYLSAINNEDESEEIQEYLVLKNVSKVGLGITTQKRTWYNKYTEQTWFNWHNSYSPNSTSNCVTFSAANNFKWTTECVATACSIAGKLCMKELPRSSSMSLLEETTHGFEPSSAHLDIRYTSTDESRTAMTAFETTQDSNVVVSITSTKILDSSATLPAVLISDGVVDADITSPPWSMITEIQTSMTHLTMSLVASSQAKNYGLFSTQPVTDQPGSDHDTTMDLLTTSEDKLTPTSLFSSDSSSGPLLVSSILPTTTAIYLSTAISSVTNVAILSLSTKSPTEINTARSSMSTETPLVTDVVIWSIDTPTVTIAEKLSMSTVHPSVSSKKDLIIKSPSVMFLTSSIEPTMSLDVSATPYITPVITSVSYEVTPLSLSSSTAKGTSATWRTLWPSDTVISSMASSTAVPESKELISNLSCRKQIRGIKTKDVQTYNCLCRCNCMAQRTQLNKTSLDKFTEVIRQKLKVPKKNISAIMNKKISITDHRASATVMGTISIIVIFGVLFILIISDIGKIGLEIKRRMLNLV